MRIVIGRRIMMALQRSADSDYNTRRIEILERASLGGTGNEYWGVGNGEWGMKKKS